MARKLSEEFINELKEGKFHSVLQVVLDDNNLDLELRGDRITIYYRGGKLLTLNSNGTFEALDPNYQKSTTALNIVPSLDNLDDYILRAKKIIDYHITHAEKNNLGEKDIQQMIVRENNYSPIHKDTDFFIIDTEYEDKTSEGRFDIIALQWNSTNADHRYKKVELAFIEVKQGSGSIKGDSGLLDHALDYKTFTNANNPTFNEFKKDMLSVFKQKVYLGLIPKAADWTPNAIEDFNLSDETKFYVILANYNPEHSALSDELNAMEEKGITDCLFFTSSFCGYGLYQEFIKTQAEIKNIADKNKRYNK